MLGRSFNDFLRKGEDLKKKKGCNERFTLNCLRSCHKVSLIPVFVSLTNCLKCNNTLSKDKKTFFIVEVCNAMGIVLTY